MLLVYYITIGGNMNETSQNILKSISKTYGNVTYRYELIPCKSGNENVYSFYVASSDGDEIDECIAEAVTPSLKLACELLRYLAEISVSPANGCMDILSDNLGCPYSSSRRDNVIPIFIIFC